MGLSLHTLYCAMGSAFLSEALRCSGITYGFVFYSLREVPRERCVGSGSRCSNKIDLARMIRRDIPHLRNYG